MVRISIAVHHLLSLSSSLPHLLLCSSKEAMVHTRTRDSTIAVEDLSRVAEVAIMRVVEGICRIEVAVEGLWG